MANAKRKSATVSTPTTEAAASMSMLGQLTASAEVTPAAVVARTYGGKDSLQTARLSRYGATQYVTSMAGAKRLATQYAKRDLDSRYACAAQIADLLTANGTVTADQYMAACETAGCEKAGTLAFSKRGSTNNAYSVFAYYVAKKLLVPV